MLEIGSTAPDFELEDSEGNKVSLSDFRGKKVVLYFYPKDSTPGCTIEAHAFRDHKDEFAEKNTVVIGVSKDSTKSHKKFTDKHDLNFTLLSDPDKTLCSAYGVWGEKKMCGKKYMGITRTTYVIDEEGKVEKVYEKVRVKGHVKKVLSEL